MARAHCMLDKQCYTRARTCTRPRAWAVNHTRTRTHPRAHTHTEQNVTLITFPQQQ